jgi:hypothetical protein
VADGLLYAVDGLLWVVDGLLWIIDALVRFIQDDGFEILVVAQVDNLIVFVLLVNLLQHCVCLNLLLFGIFEDVLIGQVVLHLRLADGGGLLLLL